MSGSFRGVVAQERDKCDREKRTSTWSKKAVVETNSHTSSKSKCKLADALAGIAQRNLEALQAR